MDNEKGKDKIDGQKKPKDGALTIARALNSIFEAFSHASDNRGEGETLSLDDIDEWFDQANLLGEDKSFTKDEMASAFSKTAKNKKRVDIDEFQQMVEKLVAGKEMSIKELIERLKSVEESMFTHDRMHVTLGISDGNARSVSDSSPRTSGIHQEPLDK